jgi:restriction endonuclease S subunit
MCKFKYNKYLPTLWNTFKTFGAAGLGMLTAIEFKHTNDEKVMSYKDTNKLLPKFLYYSTTTRECVEYLNNKSTGSTFPAFKSEDIALYDIPIPPLEFQQSVVARMESLQAQQKMLEQHASSAEENAKFVLDGYLAN